jgi:polyisoprenoid-binding protein YceI
MKPTLGLLAAALLLSTSAYAKTYTIDGDHSSATFTIRHLVGRVAGRFTKFSGTFDYDEKNPKVWKAAATIDASSNNTANDKRDSHLRTADFFDTAKYPTLMFKSTGVTDVSGNKAKLHGDLTMHGVTQPVVLDLEIGGVMKDPMGPGTRAGAVATGKINRKDFGITNKMDSGGMIGDDVDITLNIEGVAK